MLPDDEDDKPTVVLDLNALRKEKLKQEEELANLVQELEFGVVAEKATKEATPKSETKTNAASKSSVKETTGKKLFPVILFDFQSDFFQKSLNQLPKNFDYKIAKTLPELNSILSSKTFQVVVFNYDANPKAVNQLTAQIKQKFPFSKTLIVAKNISPEKAKIHSQTPSGANGYYQTPLEEKKFEAELTKIYNLNKKAS